MEVDAEARTKRSRQQAAARGGAHERKGVQVYLDAAAVVFFSLSSVFFAVVFFMDSAI